MQTLPTKLPKYWSSKGSNTVRYQVGLDEEVQFNGKASLLIQSKDALLEDYFELYQIVNLVEWHGKRIRISGSFKSQDVKSHGVILTMVTKQGGELLVYDAMIDRSMSGTNDWHKLETVFDVPAEARFVWFGPALFGPGKFWAADFQAEIVSRDVPRTDIHGHTEVLGDGPIDLDIPERSSSTSQEYFKAARAWRYDQSESALYTIEREPNAFGDKAAWVITSKGLIAKAVTDQDAHCGAVMQTFSASPYRGKKIKFSAQIKAENCNDECCLVMMVQGPFYKWMRIATPQEGGAHGTTDWQKCTRVLYVSEQAYSISIWLQLNAGGKARFADIRVEEADPDEPETYHGAGPENMDFSEV